jgi:hypothetical protein
VEVDAVLAAARDGDVHRRCAAAAEPDAGARLMDNLNWLLDRHLRSQPGGVEDAVLRAAVLALMRDRAARAVLLGAGEAVLGATEGALRALAGAGGPAGLASAVGRGEAPPGWRVRDLGADLRLVVGEDGPA